MLVGLQLPKQEHLRSLVRRRPFVPSRDRLCLSMKRASFCCGVRVLAAQLVGFERGYNLLGT